MQCDSSHFNPSHQFPPLPVRTHTPTSTQRYTPRGSLHAHGDVARGHLRIHAPSRTRLHLFPPSSPRKQRVSFCLCVYLCAVCVPLRMLRRPTVKGQMATGVSSPSPSPSPSTRQQSRGVQARGGLPRRDMLVLVVITGVCLCYVVYVYLWRSVMAGGEQNTTSTMEADLAIIGAGLAGLSASIEAALLDPQARIVLIEREAKVGGNSAKASSGINAAVSSEDAPVFHHDTLASGAGLANTALVDVLVEESPHAIEFLKQSEVDLSVLAQLGGHSQKRTHRNKSGPNVGFAIISALQKRLSALSNVQVLTGATADAFLTTTSSSDTTATVIEGLKLRMQDDTLMELRAPAVVLATGGFSSSQKLLQRFAPGMEVFPTTNGATAQGDGIVLAEAVGADLVLMDKVQLHPTGFINPKDRDAQQKFLAPESIRGSGALLLNTAGTRFVNELATRDVVSQAILAQPGQRAFLWLFDGAEALASSLGFYKHMGLVKKVDSVQEAAEYCHFEADVVLKELQAYADAASGSTPDRLGKTAFPFPLQHINAVDTAIEIHIMEVAPAVHYCMGGVKINEQTQVLRADGSVVDGVFAAGEVSGGLHGANRLGGNSLAECVVFGRIAGRQGLQYVRPVQQ